MPTLPITLGGSLAGGAVPVAGPEDVLAELPRPHRQSSSAPVRDAILTAFAAGFRKYQDIAAYAAAQSDPLRATGDYLRAYAQERGVVPGKNESEAAIRARLFLAPRIVTPEDILDVINELLADYTGTQCAFSELDLDGWFVHDGTGEWDCFIEASPDYPSRYYEDVPWLRLPGAVPSWSYPRSFLLRIPPLEDNDETLSYVLEGDDGVFVADGTDAGGSESDGSVALFTFVDPKTADDLYQTVIGIVESIKGQGITWALVVDTSL